VDEVRAARGRAVFESARAGCARCHAGDRLTDNRNHDVGLGRATQTPALRGLAHRTRFMHDGCADSLEDRFEPACGGTAHGGIDHLGPEQLGDLVEFLRTL
jgi:cytochrome c peroxidase